MKAVLIIFAVVLFLVSLQFMGLSVRSVDYRDGAYHPIPRGRYITLMVGFAIAGFVCLRLAKRRP